MHIRATRTRVRFGRFELDPSDGELYGDGQRIHLQEQPRQILLALVARSGEIVTREELRDRLWKSDTFVDFEHGLNTAVKKVRQALGDSAEAPQYIETLAKRGYRFIGRIDPELDVISPAARAPDLSAPITPEPPLWVRRATLWSISVLLVAAAAIAGWTVLRSRGTVASPAPQQSAALAVLPLRVLAASGSAGDTEYIGVGIADAITTRLAGTRQITMRPTFAVLPFKDAQSDPGRVASLLGVQQLLLGTIQPTEHTYRISVQLVRADGVVVWARTFDEPRAELLRVQDHLAEQIASALRVELSPPERARLHVRYTNNPAAYDNYLRGRSLLVNYTEANMREAIGYFERALTIDPNYALARAGIATASAWFSVRYSHDGEARTWGKRAEMEARRALEQDGSLADAHFAIASAAGTLYGGFDWNVVLERTAAALALDPSLDLAHLERMRAYVHLGLFDQAHEERRLGRQVNPTPSVAWSRLEVALQLHAGQYQAALDKAAELFPQTDAPAVRQYLGLARFYSGDVDGARGLLSSITRGSTIDIRSQASLASIEAAIGMRNEARKRIVTLLRGEDIDHHVAYSVGAAFAQLGDADASVEWLERAADTGFPCYPWFARDPLLQPVRGHPRFVHLLARLRDVHARARHHAS